MLKASRNLKVLMLVENRSVPADARVWPEAVALRDAGFHVSIISPKGEKEDRDAHTCIDGIHIYRYRLPTGLTSTSYIVEYTVSLLETFRLSLKVWLRHGFDVIHAANPPDTFFVLGWFYRLFGKQYVFDQHDLAPELFQVLFEDHLNGRMSGLLHRLLLFLERCSYRTADLVIVTNRSFQRIATQRGRCVAGQVAVVRNGPSLQSMRTVRLEPELKMGRRYLLAYVGVMGRQDGVQNALQALHILIHQRGRQDVALVLMGDGAYAPTLRALAYDLHLEEYVHFAGWTAREGIMRYLSVADVGLSPDPHNALNDASTMIKTMEYMAMGKPIVAFDLTETRVSAGEAALYATPNRVEDFANKIEVVLDDDALRTRMGAVGRKRVQDALNWEHSRRQLLLAYDRLLGNSLNRSLPAPAVPSGQGKELASGVYTEGVDLSERGAASAR